MIVNSLRQMPRKTVHDHEIPCRARTRGGTSAAPPVPKAASGTAAGQFPLVLGRRA